MEVLQNNMVVAILGKGDLVGCDIPFSLVPETLVKSSSEVKALTYCDLKSIHISGLLEVLRMYPEFAETFCTEIIHDLTFNLREGYQMDPDTMLHGAHSLTLPSISEDDEEDEDGEDGDHDDDDSGSGSPPSSPSTGGGGGGGGGAVAVSTVAPPRKRTVLLDHWDHRGRTHRGNGEGPIIQGQHRKPALKFCNKNNLSQASKTSSERTRSKDSSNGIDTTRIDRIDSQLNSLSCEMSKLASDMRLIMELMRQMCTRESAQSSASTSEERSGIGVKLTHSDECRLVITEPSSPKCSSLTSTSSCSQLLAPSVPLKVGLSSKCCQTERSLLDDLLTKMTDSGSPPPNSGYSSSSSNEEKVKYLIHCQNRSERERGGGAEGDTESISDDSVLRPSNSLTIQSMASSRDVSPFKGSRTSFNTSSVQLGDITGSISPSPSPRPTAILATSSSSTSSSSSPATTHATSQTNPPSILPMKSSTFSHQLQLHQQQSIHKQQTNQQQSKGEDSQLVLQNIPTTKNTQEECTIDIDTLQGSDFSKDSSISARSKERPSLATSSESNSGPQNRTQRNLSTEL